MKTTIPTRRTPLASIRSASPFALALALSGWLASPSPTLHAQFFQADDFNDGNDDGWERYDALAPLGMRATYSLANGAYRIQTTYLGGSAQLTGRSGSLRPEIYSDFYAAVDIVQWNETLPQSFGLLARVQTPGLGTTTGYAFTWDRGNPTNATAGDVDISRITGEAPSGVTVMGSDSIHFETNKTYRMVFIGRGTSLEGRVYELPDTTTPVITITGSDPTYPSGQNGLVVFDNSSGRSQTDATFDNFYATDIEPPQIKVTFLSFGDYELSWPADASPYVLQRATSLTAPDWQAVPAAEIVPPGDRYAHLINPQLDGFATRYYRLIRQ